MTITLKINARNDIHLPAQVLARLNLGDERLVRLDLKGNVLVLTPVDIEPRYSKEQLDALDQVHEKQKSIGLKRIKSKTDIDKLLD